MIDDAEIAIHGVPATMGSRDSAEVQIEVLNTGTSTWWAEDGYYLIFDANAPGWTHSVEPVATAGPVGPGEREFLNGRLTSPSIHFDQPNQVVQVFARLVRLGGPRFGDAAYYNVIHSAYSPPVVLNEPEAVSTPYNGSATFAVDVVSDSETSYQWRRHTITLEDDYRTVGAHGPELTIRSLGYDDLGDYDCVITNAGGRVVTQPAPLSMVGSPVRRPSGRIYSGPPATLIRWLTFRARGHRSGRLNPRRPSFSYE